MKQEKDWFKDRGYLHFTNRTPISKRKSIFKYITSKQKVTSHSFSPLIFKEIKQRRYKISDFNGISKRSHKKVKKGKVVSNKKVREILYASHIDAHIFTYYTQKKIAPSYETYLKQKPLLSECVTAYRQIRTDCGKSFKNNVHFAKDVFNEIKTRNDCVALVLDIENFFPSLNHKKLKLAWANILGHKTLPKDHYNLFKATTRFSYVRLKDLKNKNGHFDEKLIASNRKKGKVSFFENIKELIESDVIIHKNQKKDKKGVLKGIPQGLPISALLANIYMLEFDEAIINKLCNENNVFYRRYSDDIIILCKKEEINKVENIILNEIKNVKLKISIEKTEKILFKRDSNKLQSFKINKDGSLKKNIPLNYLGFEFYGYQTLIKSKNLAKFYRAMKQTIKRKHKRVESIKKNTLLDEAPIFKRKIYRLYSFKGVKTRKIKTRKVEFINGKQNSKTFDRKFRGNYLRYAYKASEELNAPEIKRQLKNHWKILQKNILKYDFSNVKEK